MARTPTPPTDSKEQSAPPVPPVVEQPAAPAQDAAEAPSTSEPAEAGTIEARILLDHGRFSCNTLALLTAEEAETCEGWADTSPEAVAYVKSLEG